MRHKKVNQSASEETIEVLTALFLFPALCVGSPKGVYSTAHIRTFF